MIGILPTSVVTFQINPRGDYVDPPYGVLLPPKTGLLNRPLWLAGEADKNKHWLRIDMLTFPILPTATMTKIIDGRGEHIAVAIGYDTLAKVKLSIWWGVSFVLYVVFFAQIAFESFLDDGLVPYTVNGVPAGEIPVFPWVIGVLGTYFIIFIALPIAMIRLGWRRTEALMQELKARLEAEGE